MQYFLRMLAGCQFIIDVHALPEHDVSSDLGERRAVLEEDGKRGDGARGDDIKPLAQPHVASGFLRACGDEIDMRKIQCPRDPPDRLDLLPSGIEPRASRLRKEHGKRKQRKSAARPDIEK